MMYVNLQRVFAIFMIFTTNFLIAQQGIWYSIEEKVAMGSPDAVPQKYGSFGFDKTSLEQRLTSITTKKPGVFEVPMPDGTFERFEIRRGGIMNSVLADKFPQIQVFSGNSIDDRSKNIYIDVTPQGFHAMIVSAQGTILIDPYNPSNKDKVITYYERDYKANLTMKEYKKIYGVCEHDDSSITEEQAPDEKLELKGNETSQRSSGDELRTYRLAITCSGEYAQWHINRDGGGLETVLAAIVSTMNRVNGIFKQEVGINLELIPNEEDLLFLDPDTDPFITNCGNSLNEYQAELENIVPRTDYDMGHHFCVGGGGVAGQGPCLNSKGRGRSGSGFPTGNSFALLVGHEMGHQFGASHTFSGTMGNCNPGNRSDGNAYEPGSGTTIMSYYGICQSDNLTGGKHSFYHTRSFQQMFDYIHNDRRGNSCAVITNTNNTPPVADAGVGGWTIPHSTPFTLTGSGTDADNDPLTYSWEQYDLGTAGPPDNALADGPLFRSFLPAEVPSRTFPRLDELVNNTTIKGEVLPATTRELNFRLTVRDNFVEGGGVNYDALSFNVTTDAGPFLVTAPNTAQIFTGGSTIEVQWDVANTDQAPINTSQVAILLSVDGGFTYPFTLLESTTNDGSESVVLTNVETTTARIKVQAIDNIFFDISNQNFAIEMADLPTFDLSTVAIASETCAPELLNFEVNVSSILGFTDAVNLSMQNVPDGVNVTLSETNVNPPQVVQVAVEVDGTIASGIYPIRVVGTAGSEIKELEVELTLYGEPNITTDDLVEVCLNDSVELSAVGSGTIKWYDEITATTPINIGTSYVTEQLVEDQVYYVVSGATGIIETGGPIDNTFGGGGNYNNNNRGLLVDIVKPVVWKSTTVYAGSAGERVIEVQESIGGTTLFSKTVNLTQGENIVTLDFALPQGTGYYFTITSELVNVYRNNNNVNYPYTLPNVLSIVQSSSTAPLGFYYYFYNNQFSIEGECESDPTAINVVVDEIEKPAIQQNDNALSVIDNYSFYQWMLDSEVIVNANQNTFTPVVNGNYSVLVRSANGCEIISDPFPLIVAGISSVGNNSFRIAPNPIVDKIIVTLPEGIKVNYQLLSIEGLVVQEGIISNQSQVDLSGLAKSTYLLMIKTENQIFVEKVIKE